MESRFGFWPRLLAYALDLVLLLLVALATRSLISGLLPDVVAAAVARNQGRSGLLFSEYWTSVSVVATLLAPFYSLIEGLAGMSPGKWLLGMRIAAASNRRPYRWRLFLRFACKGAGVILKSLALAAGIATLDRPASSLYALVSLGFLLVLGRSHQALHDRLAKTIVVPRRHFLTLEAEGEAEVRGTSLAT